MNIVCWLLQAAYVILLAYVIFSFVPRPPGPFAPVAAAVRSMVEPVLNPLRRVMPPLSMGNVGVDLSVLVLFFALLILQRLLC